MRTRLFRPALALGLAGVASVVVLDKMPAIVEWQLHRKLAACGFPDARFRVVAVELDRLELADVELAPGLGLGTVELDAGVSLLWRDAKIATVRGARIELDALPRNAGGAGVSIGRFEITDSTVVVAGNSLAASGTIDVTGSATQLELTAPVVALGSVTIEDVAIGVAGTRACAIGYVASVRIDACATREADDLALHWTADSVHARGSARITWSDGLALRDGIATASSPRWTFDDLGLVLDRVAIRASYAGRIDAIVVDGSLEADRATVRGLALTDVRLPFALHVDDGAVSTGELVARARRLAGSIEDKSIHATDVVLRRDPLVRDAGVLPLEWSAAAVSTDQIEAVDAAGHIALDGSISWRAASVTANGVRLSDVVGTIAKDRSIGWRSASATTRDMRLEHVAGTVANDRTVAWTARSLATRELFAETLAGTIDPSGTVRWRAATLSARDVRVTDPSGVVNRDGSIDWTARTLHWGDWIARAPVGHVDAGTLTARTPRVECGDLVLANVRAVIDREPASATLHWQAEAATLGSRSAAELTGDVFLDDGSVRVAWKRARYAALVFGPGDATVVRRDGWMIERGHAAAYGGIVTLVRPARTDVAELEIRGVELALLLRAFPGHGDGSGTLDGNLAMRDGKLERLALATTAGGRLRFGDRAWLDRVVAGIDAGEVAFPERIAGALADFEYTRLGILLTPDRDPDLRVSLHGRGRRVAQELDLTVNVRGLRETSAMLARHKESP